MAECHCVDFIHCSHPFIIRTLLGLHTMSELFTDMERAGITVGITMDGTVGGITNDL